MTRNENDKPLKANGQLTIDFPQEFLDNVNANFSNLGNMVTEMAEHMSLRLQTMQRYMEMFDNTVRELSEKVNSRPLTEKDVAVLNDLAKESVLEEPVVEAKKDAKDLPLSDLELSKRTVFWLKTEKLVKVSDVINKSEDDLLAIRNFGKRGLIELKNALAGVGLSIKEKIPAKEVINLEQALAKPVKEKAPVHPDFLNVPKSAAKVADKLVGRTKEYYTFIANNPDCSTKQLATAANVSRPRISVALKELLQKKFITCKKVGLEYTYKAVLKL